MVGLLGCPSLDHQLQQAVKQLLALGMEQGQSSLSLHAFTLPAAAGSVDDPFRAVGDLANLASSLPQVQVYLSYTEAVQRLLQHHGGRLLAGGDPATALQLVAMLRGMAAAQQQVRANPAP